MHKLALVAAASVALLGAASAETRNLSGFEGVHAEGRFDVNVTVGEAYSVTISGSDADKIRAEIEDGVLKLEPRNRPWFGGEPQLNADVRITTPRLTSLVSARGAEVEASNVNADAFSLVAAMGGTVRVAGTCANLDATAAMGGALDASELRCATADVTAAMGGDARVFASQTLDATAAMGGSVRVAGEPAHTEISTSMGGGVSLR